MQAFSSLDGIASAAQRLQELREARDAAHDRVAELRSLTTPSVRVSASDWDTLTLDERCDLIRAVLDSVVVSPGRGSDRIAINPRG